MVPSTVCSSSTKGIEGQSIERAARVADAEAQQLARRDVQVFGHGEECVLVVELVDRHAVQGLEPPGRPVATEDHRQLVVDRHIPPTEAGDHPGRLWSRPDAGEQLERRAQPRRAGAATVPRRRTPIGAVVVGRVAAAADHGAYREAERSRPERIDDEIEVRAPAGSDDRRSFRVEQATIAQQLDGAPDVSEIGVDARGHVVAVGRHQPLVSSDADKTQVRRSSRPARRRVGTRRSTASRASAGVADLQQHVERSSRSGQAALECLRPRRCCRRSTRIRRRRSVRARSRSATHRIAASSTSTLASRMRAVPRRCSPRTCAGVAAVIAHAPWRRWRSMICGDSEVLACGACRTPVAAQ